MIRFFLTGLFITTTLFSWAQPIGKIITRQETERIERTLASDDMRGRKVFSPEIDKAADFIAAEFQKAGLQPMSGSSFRQEFSIVRPKFISVAAAFDGTTVDPKNVIVVTCQPELNLNEQSGYEVAWVKSGGNLQSEARAFVRSKKNLLVLVESSFANSFKNLVRLKSSMFRINNNVVFVLTDKAPAQWSLEARHDITEQKMANVVGVLPGKSRKDEFVIFSGHYDHLGVGNPENGDSIYNGANDDAAGTTAVIMLAKYYATIKNNERTLVFAAFTAEETGGFGSSYFSQQLEPASVMAMFNIEMIGTESKWGKNSAYITGYDKTNMGDILAKDLQGTEFTFYPDPYPAQQLFYRSDNATLARLGVPAHTLSTSKMDVEPHYHKLTDHVETLDLDNMTEVIKAIALSARSIIAGTATPTRVQVSELR